MPTLDLGPVVGPQGPQGETGPAGPQGVQGPAGPSATINGLPAVTITGGEKIQLEQDGTDLTINCTASNQNLVINGDFRNPVNRNGKTKYTGIVYGIDGWRGRNSASVITVLEGAVKIESSSESLAGGFLQYLYEKEPAIGTQLTFSVLTDDGVLYTTTADYRDTPGTFLLDTALGLNFGGGQVAVFSRNGYEGASRNIVAMKLELGSQQTLTRKNTDGEWELIDPPDYALQYALCSQYSPLTGEFVGSQQSNPNLVDNPYLIDPINQIGKTEYTQSGYGIDRWVCDGAVTVLNGYIKAGNNFYQRAPAELTKNLLGKTLTLSVLYQDGTLEYGSLTVPASIPASNGVGVAATSKLSIYLYSNGQMQIFRLSGSNEIVAVKTELGPVQTLAHKEGDTWVLNDPPPNKALELAKCQRYQSVLTANGNNITIATGRCLSDGNITVALPIGPLRIIPANIANPTGLIAATDIFSGTTFPITAVTFIGYRPGEKMITALFKCPSGTVGTIYRVGLLSGNSLVFNANL